MTIEEEISLKVPAPSKIKKPRRQVIRLPYKSIELTSECILEDPEHSGEIVRDDNSLTSFGISEKDFLEALNIFDWEDLTSLDGITGMMAHNIIKSRKKFGEFTDLDEILRIQSLTPIKFKKFIGRPCCYKKNSMKFLFIWPVERPIFVSDLQPYQGKISGLNRITFDRNSSLENEKRIASENGNKLVIRKIGSWNIYIHKGVEKMNDVAKRFILQLPKFIKASIKQKGYTV